MDKYIGIDIAKQTFDVYGPSISNERRFIKLNHTQKEYKKLIKDFGADKTYVMEATGPYYMNLACFLFEKGIKVAVVNPLIIKRFSQMNLQRAKTDKKDAKTIHDYARYHGVKLWEPPREEIKQMQQILTALELLNKQHTATSNQLNAFSASGSVDPQIKKTLSSLLLKYKREIKKLETQLETIIEECFAETQQLLLSIPGIGKKAAAVLIAITNNFEKFIHYKQLIAYVGFSPRIYESGTSIKGKGHICKMGKQQVRKLLYMCAWSAKYHNEGCIDQYKRLKEKGKPERVIKVAIANKLLKQAFAVVSSKQTYSLNHKSILSVGCA